MSARDERLIRGIDVLGLPQFEEAFPDLAEPLWGAVDSGASVGWRRAP